MSYMCEIHGRLQMSQVCPDCLDELRITPDELNAIWRAKLILDEYHKGTEREWYPSAIKQASTQLHNLVARLKTLQ